MLVRVWLFVPSYVGRSTMAVRQIVALYVAGSSPAGQPNVSKIYSRHRGGIGIRSGLKIRPRKG